MAAIVGRGGAILLGVESTYGTAVSRTVTMQCASFSGFAEVQEWIPRNTCLRDAGFRSQHIDGRINATGKVSKCDMTYQNLGVIWYAGVGAASSSGAGPYTHTYSTDTTLPFFTIEPIRGSAANMHLARGCTLNKLTLAMEEGGPLTSEQEWNIQHTNAAASAGSVSVGSGQSVIMYHQLGAVTINSIAQAKVKNLSIMLDNNLQERRGHGSKYTDQPEIGPERKVTVELEVEYDTVNLELAHALNLAGTNCDVDLTFTGTGNNSLVISLYNLLCTVPPDFNVQDAGVLRHKFTMEARGDGTTNGIKFVITNDNSSNVAN